MDNNNNPGSSFKHISLVPDYRAWQIIQEQSGKINSLLSSPECDKLLRIIAKEDDFRRFRKSLLDVKQHIKRNASVALQNLDTERSQRLVSELKQHLSLTPTEIVMVLNQMPNHESLIELMFAGKFTKEQIGILCHLVNQYLSNDTNIVGATTKENDQTNEKYKKDEKQDSEVLEFS